MTNSLSNLIRPKAYLFLFIISSLFIRFWAPEAEYNTRNVAYIIFILFSLLSFNAMSFVDDENKKVKGALLIIIVFFYITMVIMNLSDKIPYGSIFGKDIKLKLTAFANKLPEPPNLLQEEESSADVNKSILTALAKSNEPDVLILEYSNAINIDEHYSISFLHLIVSEQRRAMDPRDVKWIITFRKNSIHSGDKHLEAVFDVNIFSTDNPEKSLRKRFSGRSVRGVGGAMRPIRKLGAKTRWVKDSVSYSIMESSYPRGEVREWLPLDFTYPKMGKKGFFAPENRFFWKMGFKNK